MPLFSGKQRLLIAIGGLVLFIGFTMLGLAILGIFNVLKIEVLLQHFKLMIGISAALGVLDIIIGFFLLFPNKGKGIVKIREKSFRIIRVPYFLGFIEIFVGLITIVIAILSHFNLIRILIVLPSDFFPLFTFGLLILGFVFTINGFFVIDKVRKGRQ